MSDENEFTWTVKADLPAARWFSASAIRDGKLWAIGGCVTGIGPTYSVMTYDPEQDTWATGPPLPYAASGWVAATHNGDLHLTSQTPGLSCLQRRRVA